MLLNGVKAENGWLRSRWTLTYRVSWDALLKACAFSSDFYLQFEVLLDYQEASVQTNEDIMALLEARTLSFRGFSTIVKAPIVITFYNQLDIVDVDVAMATEEFSQADYERFNKSLGQYLNSIELVMHR